MESISIHLSWFCRYCNKSITNGVKCTNAGSTSRKQLQPVEFGGDFKIVRIKQCLLSNKFDSFDLLCEAWNLISISAVTISIWSSLSKIAAFSIVISWLNRYPKYWISKPYWTDTSQIPYQASTNSNSPILTAGQVVQTTPDMHQYTNSCSGLRLWASYTLNPIQRVKLLTENL